LADFGGVPVDSVRFAVVLVRTGADLVRFGGIEDGGLGLAG
jgi:hypothetical protein